VTDPVTLFSYWSFLENHKILYIMTGFITDTDDNGRHTALVPAGSNPTSLSGEKRLQIL
jgi:hypothetical protein